MSRVNISPLKFYWADCNYYCEVKTHTHTPLNVLFHQLPVASKRDNIQLQAITENTHAMKCHVHHVNCMLSV